ncbi:hypothetical protein HII31_06161 [Pseudocercospora fuligena]|uniref:Uncharacterized protein n=1 Tax=Pseudocercospora fuligena TaxID=685502 RepID=A0A8H6RKF1_9PEZI|nr:hypothetical protein HII31_06161 [Pseudocercospora fuligena]
MSQLQSSRTRKILQRIPAKVTSKRRTFENTARKTMDAITTLLSRVRKHDLRKHKLPRLSGEIQQVKKQEYEQVFPPPKRAGSTNSAAAASGQTNSFDEPTSFVDANDQITIQQEPEVEVEEPQPSASEQGELLATELELETQQENSDYQEADFEPCGFQASEQQTLEVQDFEDEQALRDAQYVVLEPELESDYTRGPARVVAINDGVQDDCCAMLMTYDLSQKIKQSTLLQRQLSQEKRHAQAQQREISKFLRRLNIEIKSHKNRIARANGNETAEQSDTLQNELECLELIQADMEWKRDNIAANLQMRSAALIDAQAEVAQILDEAFVCAALLEPETDEEIPVETFDLQDEYQKLHARQQAEAEEEGEQIIYEPVAPLDTSKDHLETRAPTPTPEEQAEQELRQNFWAAKERVKKATEEFELKEGVRDQEKRFNEQAWATGEEPLDADREAFDLRWFVRIHEITHELVEAEAALKQAQLVAREGNVDLFDDDQSQGFPDDEADGRHGSGYDLSDEEMTRFFAYTKDDARINAWLDNVSETADAETQPAADVDQWPSREVDISDSFTVVAFEPARREQIAEWQRKCDAVRASCQPIE